MKENNNFEMMLAEERYSEAASFLKSMKVSTSEDILEKKKKASMLITIINSKIKKV